MNDKEIEYREFTIADGKKLLRSEEGIWAIQFRPNSPEMIINQEEAADELVLLIESQQNEIESFIDRFNFAISERDGARRVAVEYREENQQLQDKLNAITPALKKFIQVAFDGADLDGGTVQEICIKYGLLREAHYDPEKHGEIDYAEVGDLIYEHTELLSHIQGKEEKE